MTVDTLNYIFALGGIAMVLGGGILIFDAYSKNWSFGNLFDTYGVWFAYVLTLTGSLVTLFYSEVLGFEPCGLCWMQRVFLYPQVFIFGTALYTKDKNAWKYSFVLSIPGLVIALYQHYLQMGGAEFITCPITNTGADCAQRTLFEFGFVTFPLISAAVFVLLIAMYWYKTKRDHTEQLIAAVEAL